METDILPINLMENILSRVRLKSRTRMKCVCKSWCAIITRLRQSLSPTTSSGLVLHSRPFPNRGRFNATLLAIKDSVGKCSLQSSYILNNIDKPILLHSCNGLLLYRTEINEMDDFYHCTLYISNPILQQCRALPPALPPLDPGWRKLGFGYLLKRALSFAFIDFSGSQEHFKVICNFGAEMESGTETFKLHIFESESWEWTENYTKVMSICPQMYSSEASDFCWVLMNGEMYGIWGQCMLIYSFEKGMLKVVQLPQPKSSHLIESRILWESEGSLY